MQKARCKVNGRGELSNFFSPEFLENTPNTLELLHNPEILAPDKFQESSIFNNLQTEKRTHFAQNVTDLSPDKKGAVMTLQEKYDAIKSGALRIDLTAKELRQLQFPPARIHLLRQHLLASCQGFADALGVSRQTVYLWESGETIPGHNNIGSMRGLEAFLSEEQQQELKKLAYPPE